MGWRWKYRLPHRCLVRTIQWKVLLRWHCHHLCPNLKARITKKPGTTLWGFSTTVIKREIKAKPKLCKFGSVAKPQSCKYVQVSNPKTAAQRRCSKRRPRRICLGFCSRGWSHSALSLHLVWWRWRSFLSRSYTEWMIEFLNYTLNWSECILFYIFGVYWPPSLCPPNILTNATSAVKQHDYGSWDDCFCSSFWIPETTIQPNYTQTHNTESLSAADPTWTRRMETHRHRTLMTSAPRA